MSINSRRKGKRVELMACEFLRSLGFTCRRGQQFAGGTDSPDVIVEELPGVHIEVKGDNSIRLGNKAWQDAMAQAFADADGKYPVLLWYVGRGQDGKIGWRMSCWHTGATYIHEAHISRVLRGLQSQADVDREIKKATGGTQ